MNDNPCTPNPHSGLDSLIAGLTRYLKHYNDRQSCKIYKE